MKIEELLKAMDKADAELASASKNHPKQLLAGVRPHTPGQDRNCIHCRKMQKIVEDIVNLELKELGACRIQKLTLQTFIRLIMSVVKKMEEENETNKIEDNKKDRKK
jgi:hypothetical protein